MHALQGMLEIVNKVKRKASLHPEKVMLDICCKLKRIQYDEHLPENQMMHPNGTPPNLDSLKKAAAINEKDMS